MSENDIARDGWVLRMGEIVSAMNASFIPAESTRAEERGHVVGGK